jgi:hypothetical protein
VELHFTEKVESSKIVALQRMAKDPYVMGDAADAIGRIAILHPMARVPGLMDRNSASIMERGRIFFGSIPIEVGRGILQSIDVIIERAHPWAAETRTLNGTWGQVFSGLKDSAITGLASEMSGSLLPLPSATRQVQSLGKWTTQPAAFSTPFGQSFGKFITELAIGQTVRQAVNW